MSSKTKRSRPLVDVGKEEEMNNTKYGDIFIGFRKELDSRYDAQERLVKLSRDCNIQSKRVIFTLHQFTGTTGSREHVLNEAESKFNKNVFPHLRSIALELAGRDPHQFLHSYSPGLQEFIEAISFYEYLKSGRLISFEEVQKYITFQPKEVTEMEEEKQDKCKDILEAEEEAMSVGNMYSDPWKSQLIVLPLSYSDFLLGLADLTGELMRLSVNAVGNGNMSLPFSLLPFFRAIACGFYNFGPGVRSLDRKMTVLQASLRKVENICYTIKVRGSEMPKHALIDILTTAADNESKE